MLETLFRRYLKHLNAKLQQNCNWLENQDIPLIEKIDRDYVLELLTKRINNLDIVAAKRNVETFVTDKRSLDI